MLKRGRVLQLFFEDDDLLKIELYSNLSGMTKGEFLTFLVRNFDLSVGGNHEDKEQQNKNGLGKAVQA